MAKFCNQCGRPLEEGEICECQLKKDDQKTQDTTEDTTEDIGETKKISKEDIEKERKEKANNYENTNKRQNSNYKENNYSQKNQNNNANNSYYNSEYNGSYNNTNDKNFMDDLNYWQGRFQEKVGSSFKEKMDGFKEISDDMSSNSQEIIVPNRISSAEGEIPIKQYDIATFKNIFMGFIPYSKANCKMLVSNKRLLLSAKGLDLKGEMNYQNEFSINEISGIDFVQGFMPNLFRFLIGILICYLSIRIYVKVGFGIFGDSVLPNALISLVLGILASILIRRNNFLHLLASSAILYGYSIFAAYMIYNRNPWALTNIDSLTDIPPFYLILLLLVFIYTLFRVWMFAQVANLKLIIQTKPGLNAINIEKRNRKLFGLLDDAKDMNTGFTYIVPARDTELARRELGSIIKDIQNLGDDAIGKWKNI